MQLFHVTLLVIIGATATLCAPEPHGLLLKTLASLLHPAPAPAPVPVPVPVVTHVVDRQDIFPFRIVEKEVIKEVPGEVEKIVEKEVVKEVPVDRFFERIVHVPVEVVRQVPVEFVRQVPVDFVHQVPVEVVHEVPAVETKLTVPFPEEQPILVKDGPYPAPTHVLAKRSVKHKVKGLLKKALLVKGAVVGGALLGGVALKKAAVKGVVKVAAVKGKLVKKLVHH